MRQGAAGAGADGRSAWDPQRDTAQREAVATRIGTLVPLAMEALRSGRGRDFQRLEFIGDSILELVLHAHSVITGPGCPYCQGRADRFTTDAHLGELAVEINLGDWLDWHPSEHRLADLVEACSGATYISGGWAQVVGFVAAELHPLTGGEQRMVLHGGAQVHAEAPARAREILGAAILEAAAAIAAYRRDPMGDEGDLSRIRARMLTGEHILGRCRESRWVRRAMGRRRFDRDDVERELAEHLLAHGIASAVSIAWPLTT